MRQINFPIYGGLAGALALVLCHPLAAAVQRAAFSNNNAYLVVETLNDEIFHAEFAAGTAPSGNLYASPMIFKGDYTGPSTYSQNGTLIRTARSEARVDPVTLCISITDRTKQTLLTVVCPADLADGWKGLTITKQQSRSVYGLGQELKRRCRRYVLRRTELRQFLIGHFRMKHCRRDAIGSCTAESA